MSGIRGRLIIESIRTAPAASGAACAMRAGDIDKGRAGKGAFVTCPYLVGGPRRGRGRPNSSWGTRFGRGGRRFTRDRRPFLFFCASRGMVSEGASLVLDFVLSWNPSQVGRSEKRSLLLS